MAGQEGICFARISLAALGEHPVPAQYSLLQEVAHWRLTALP